MLSWSDIVAAQLRFGAPNLRDAGFDIDDRPVVIDFRTDYREKVYPMVPAGAPLNDMIDGGGD